MLGLGLAGEFEAPKRIWVTEIGWPTHVTDRGVDERTQAIYLVRTMALLQATRLVEKVHWYDFKDDGLNREYNEDNFGVVRHQRLECAPKPAVVAASVFARMTAGAKVVSFERDGVYRVNYETPDGKKLAVVWVPEGQEPVKLELEETEACYDLMGERLPAERSVEVGAAPVYVVGAE